MIHTSASQSAPFGASWLAEAGAGLDDAGRALLDKAVQCVGDRLAGQLASTGELLADHSAAVACILAKMGADAETRASSLLAVLPEDGRAGSVGADVLRKAFGPDVTALVLGTRALLRLGRLAVNASDSAASGTEQKEMQRKMLLAMAADLRIVLMRLASRLQSLRWYASTRTPCPRAFARETMELYTPLANRLGIWQIKWEMEDLAFRFLEPDTYKSIARQLEEKRAEREAFIAGAVKRLRAALHDAHIAGQVHGRPKHIYSIYNKMRNKHLAFNQLYDLRALRVIVEDERACYGALALVHSLWTPVSDEFDDYISRPKPNGYRSLHTVVTDDLGRSFEVQIRTREMHEFAEYGMAAHWRYKEAGARGGQVSAAGAYDQKIAWMRQLLAWDTALPGDAESGAQGARDAMIGGEAVAGAAIEAGNAAPLGAMEQARPATRAGGKSAQADEPASGERIYVLTPQARVIELPAGATPVDFAYHLHTDLGHRCRGARVDGQMVPLQTQLTTGQTVEIVATKSGGPSRDWLNPQLGFLASQRSRAKVRAWFNAVELQQRIAQGQAMVEKELQRLGKTAVNLEQLAQQLAFARADDLYVAVAKEEFSLRNIDNLLAGRGKAAEALHEGADEARVYASGTANVARTGRSGVLVVGVDALLTQLARCCRPAPPDEIVGFVTRGRGVSIHRRDCASYAVLAARHPERLIDVDWGDTGDALYPIDIAIHAPERANLLRDLSDVFAKLRLKVVGVNTHSRRSLAHMVFTIEVRNGEQIARALTALNELSGVSAARQ
ncbi:RelA/SpoT family protein [Paracandidimonas lactea]|uniref:RelA/SpoT family protein n=1 Tax=Paracandidimonas lactea TaxID=2895524 RepID=UPI001F2AE2E5|nr:bifunctional (p)ppGpp synthetase/guanosine-3',5'-bis(diphosphate) 3'-pyrophosphohydrolase [Paracandidimonas lactea]